jgi:hypothetical protein
MPNRSPCEKINLLRVVALRRIVLPSSFDTTSQGTHWAAMKSVPDKNGRTRVRALRRQDLMRFGDLNPDPTSSGLKRPEGFLCEEPPGGPPRCRIALSKSPDFFRQSKNRVATTMRTDIYSGEPLQFTASPGYTPEKATVPLVILRGERCTGSWQLGHIGVRRPEMFWPA